MGSECVSVDENLNVVTIYEKVSVPLINVDIFLFRERWHLISLGSLSQIHYIQNKTEPLRKQ